MGNNNRIIHDENEKINMLISMDIIRIGLVDDEGFAYIVPVNFAYADNKIINEVIASLDDSMKKNFGAVMKAVMAKVGASAEGKKVSELIKGII